ncbi:Zn-ribbon domain-containing OB-fold protein [Bacillus sp. FJAT-29814]|uniref:Zn-ribbon domain-containing OB-fold protein n=1 Tax=Bacillus sp. FJAT-29814 TaxID=1729688 RepID=UPI00083039D2|nr:OB-fold domain-containing protein [Bacillus sp. FJAT-29814]
MTQKQSTGITPEMTPESEFWWEKISEHELHVQACHDCEKKWFPPVYRCPYCASKNWEWVKTSGQGKVFSWTVVHRAFDPAFAEDLPYTVLTVELEEGAKILGRLIPSDDRFSLKADMPVKATFYKVGDQTLLGFAKI